MRKVRGREASRKLSAVEAFRAGETDAERLIAIQYELLSEHFSDAQLQALGQRCDAGDLARLCGVVEGLVDADPKNVRSPDAIVELVAAKSDRRLSALVETVGAVANIANKLERLSFADDDEIASVRKEIDGFFADRCGYWEHDGDRRRPADSVVALTHVLDVLEFVMGVCDTGGPYEWERLREVRDLLMIESTAQKRAAVVFSVESALGDLRGLELSSTEADDCIRSGADAIKEELIKNRAFREFYDLDVRFVADLLRRGDAASKKALGAPYIAAAIGLSVRAFGDDKEPGETDEEARRRWSNVYRNNANAERTKEQKRRRST